MTALARPATRWRLRNPRAREQANTGFPPIVATVLAARGITTRAAAEVFYKPHLAPDHDPLLLPGMLDAIRRLQRDIHDHETVALYGDFDVDGVTSVAVLTLRVGGTSCTDGTIVPGTSGSYTSSPNPISTPIDTASLVEGVNKIFVCLTDTSVPSIIHMASATVTKDTTIPTVTLNQAAGQPDPASALPINFTAVFSEAIDPDTFSPADITYTGGVTGVTWTILPAGDNKTFTVRATALSGSGALTPSIPANAVTDMAGNGSTASTWTDNTVTYTSVIPQGVVISEFRTLGPAGAKPSGLAPSGTKHHSRPRLLRAPERREPEPSTWS